MFGGTGKKVGSENMNDLWVYEHGAFREIAVGGHQSSLPPGMYGHSLSYVNNALFVIGGTTGFDYFKEVFRFDLAINMWQKVKATGD